MIEITGLSKEFSGVKILNNVSMSVKPGGITVVLGKNGSGKSVLLKIAAALLKPDSGNVKINGTDVTPEIYSDSGTKAPIGYIFQKGGLFDSMNLYDNLAFALRRKKTGEDVIEKLVLNSLKRVGLEGAEMKFPSELSGGMQKRAGLARVLVIGPSLILYDDPTAGLDPILTDSIADLILEIRETENVASIVVTHDVKFARKIADSVVLIVNSEFVFNGMADDFFSLTNPYAKQFTEGLIEGPIDFLQ